jgi:redox-sensitive bicupin YhaK (pirin superfamily)
VMVEAAQTHAHKYDTAITKAYNRIAEKRGKKIATVAAARRLLMCHFGSDNPKDYIKGFPWYPHRGMETVTRALKTSLRTSA